MTELSDTELEALRKKYFPRVLWGEMGPIRRHYLAQTVPTVTGTVIEALIALGTKEQFIEPGQHAVTGGPAETLDAFRRRAEDNTIGMIFGETLDAHWCDIAVDPPSSTGWQRLLVRSEEGENLIALAHQEGILRFRRDN